MPPLGIPKYDLSSFPQVYEPAEYTILFMDVLKAEKNFLKQLNLTSVVEVGCGSGVVISTLGSIIGRKCAYFATDINPEACHATKLTAKLNELNIECLNMTYLDNFNVKFDLILFNPPFEVSTKDKMKGIGLNRAVAGGENGREIMNVFLNKLENFLNDNGVFYMTMIKENNPDSINDFMREKGYKFEFMKKGKYYATDCFIYKYFK